LEAILDGRDKHARQVILNDQFDFGRWTIMRAKTPSVSTSIELLQTDSDRPDIPRHNLLSICPNTSRGWAIFSFHYFEQYSWFDWGSWPRHTARNGTSLTGLSLTTSRILGVQVRWESEYDHRNSRGDNWKIGIACWVDWRDNGSGSSHSIFGPNLENGWWEGFEARE
jgi:hypothetical protein